MKIEVLKESFSVCKVDDFQGVDLSDQYCFIGKTDEERSLVCATEHVPDHVIQKGSRLESVQAKGHVGLFVNWHPC